MRQLFLFGKHGLALQKNQEAKQKDSDADGRQTDIERPFRKRESEFDRVFSWREINTAHDEVAAEEFSRLAVHEHAPVRIKPVVEQQH